MLIGGKIYIPDSELNWQFVQASGPGGQNVNKVATAVRLSLPLRDSVHIPEQLRERLLTRLGTRLNADGELVVTAREERTQHANRRAALEKLERLITDALVVRRMRKPTRPTAGSVRRRLQAKAEHAARKAGRRQRFDSEE